MLQAFKLTAGYFVVMMAIFIPCIGMAGSLFIQEWYYLIPMIFGTFLLIFVVHSPLLKYIETTQRKIFDV
jgi:hypothetical protein